MSFIHPESSELRTRIIFREDGRRTHPGRSRRGWLRRRGASAGGKESSKKATTSRRSSGTASRPAAAGYLLLLLLLLLSFLLNCLEDEREGLVTATSTGGTAASRLLVLR